jgi:uncharacterized membrane protein YphA (DoxX/SURF4 family)
MNIALWIVQGILAVLFGIAGLTKSTQPKEKLEKQLPWVKDFSLKTVRFIGLAEFLGAIGLILPQLTGVFPILTHMAAAGLAVTMILAAAMVHYPKKEYKATVFNTVLFLLSAFVAFGRM